MALRNPLAQTPAVAQSRNLFPSFPGGRGLFGDEGAEGDAVRATIDIQEPLSIRPGERKTVPFSYLTGIPESTAFGLTWHLTEEDAELLVKQVTDTLLPQFTITPPYPRIGFTGTQQGEVRMVADLDIPYSLLWGALAIYQPGHGPIIVVND